MYLANNEKLLKQGDVLNWTLETTKGEKADISITVDVIALPDKPPHNVGVRVDALSLPDDVEFQLDNTCQFSQKIGIVVRGGMNEVCVTFKGESFPLFSVHSRRHRWESEQTVPGEFATLYFQALPKEFSGGLVLSHQNKATTYGLE
jgi:hypothetical protein